MISLSISNYLCNFASLIINLYKMNQYVVGIGEVLWDILVKEGRYILGGAPLNFAYHTKQFGCNSLVISAIGDDDLGRQIEASLQQKQLPYYLAYVLQETGVVHVEMTDGIPRYDIVNNKAWDYIPLTEELLSIASETKAVCFGSLAQRNAVSRATIYAFLDAIPADSLRIYDINLRLDWYSKEIIATSLNKANVFKINDEELVVFQELFDYVGMTHEETCRRIMQEYGLKLLILTCGADGSYVFSESEMSFLPTNKVKVIDTVGAGDSFTASFIASVLNGKSLRDAHLIAVNVSAYVCTQSGATPVIPETLKDLS